ncbi:MAG TPA: hypothetical protein VMC10_05405, partial [Stellaceae bacterium]|nr:hypothetical protein [Stellaceae bacterium]
VSFTSTVNGAHFLSVLASKAITVGGLIGGTTALTSLTANGSTVTLNGIGTAGADGVTGAVSVTGSSGISLAEGTYHGGSDQTYTGPVTLLAGTTMTSDGGDLRFAGTQSTINGTHALSLVAVSGTVSLGGSVGNLAELTGLNVDPAGIILGGAVYHTSGDQTYSQAVTLGASTSLTSDAGNITFLGTIDGNQSLAATANAGAITVDGLIGGSTALSALTLRGGTVALNGIGTSVSDGVTGSVSIAGSGGISLAEGTYHSGSDQTYAGPVSLLADTSVTSDGGNVAFTSTINGAHVLSVRASKAITVGGPIGGTTALTSLTANGSTVSLNGIGTAGADGVTGAVSVTGGSGISLAEGTYRSGGDQTYTGPVTLLADTSVTSDGGTVSFTSTVNGAHFLSVLASKAITVGGLIGGTTALTSLTANGSTVSLNGIGTAGADGVTGTVSVTGGGISLAEGTYHSGSDQTYTGPVTLAADTTMTSDGGDLRFAGTQSTINGTHALSLVAASGTVSLGGSVGNTAELTGLDVDPASIILGGALYHTAGDQTYSQAVTLGASTSLASDSGSITFLSTIDGSGEGGQSLGATAAHAIAVDGLIGGSTALTSLTLSGSTVTLSGIGSDGAGVTGTVSVTGGSITLDEGTYHSGGTQSWNGPVLLGANTVITSDSGDIDFVGTQSTINSLSSESPFSLKLVAAASGTVSLGGSVGNLAELTSLDVDPGSIILGGAVYHTTGDQTYSQAVTLGASTSLASDAGNITFLGTIDGSQSLAATANAGAITVDGLIGGSAALTALSLTGNAVILDGIGGEGAGVSGTVGVSGATGLTLNGGAYHSGGTQTYSGAVTLGADTSITSDSGSVVFSSTIDGAQALSVSATQGAISVGGLIGGNTALTSLTLDGQTVSLSGIDHPGESDGAGVTGTVSVSGSGGITLGDGVYHSGSSQTYSGPVTLTADTVFTSDSGAITVTGALNGSGNLGIVDSGSDSFASIGLDGILDLSSKTAGAFTANGAVNAAGLLTGTGDYALNLLGGGTIGDPTLANTGGITLAGSFLFADGFSTSQSITLGGATQLNTETSGITLGSISQGAFEFIVIADSVDILPGSKWSGTGPRGITPFSDLSIGVGDAPGQWTLNQQQLDVLADPPELVIIGGGSQIALALQSILTGQSPFVPANMPGPVNVGTFTFNAPLIIEGSSIFLSGTVTQTTPNTGIGLITPGSISGPGMLNLGVNTGILPIVAGSADLTGIVNGQGGAGAAGNTTLILQLGPGPFLINGVCFAGAGCNTGLAGPSFVLTPQLQQVITNLLNNNVNGNNAPPPDQPGGGFGGSGGGGGNLANVSPAAGGDTGTDATVDALTQPLNAGTAPQAVPRVQGYYVSLLGNLLYEWRQLARLARGANVPEENNDFSSWGNEARW